MVQPLWERIQHFLRELNIHLVNNSEILFPSVYPSEMKTHVHRDLNKNGFMALFIIAPTCKQLSPNWGMDKQAPLCSYSGILFSSKKESTSDT